MPPYFQPHRFIAAVLSNIASDCLNVVCQLLAHCESPAHGELKHTSTIADRVFRPYKTSESGSSIVILDTKLSSLRVGAWLATAAEREAFKTIQIPPDTLTQP